MKDFHSYFPAEMSSGDAIRDTMAKLNLPGNLLPKPLKTAVDIAMYDLFGKLTGKPVRSIFGIQDAAPVLCSYTLGISSVEVQQSKVASADDFKLFKLKLGGANDRERLEAFIASGHSLFCVDANQAWKSVEEALFAIAAGWCLRRRRAVSAALIPIHTPQNFPVPNGFCGNSSV